MLLLHESTSWSHTIGELWPVSNYRSSPSFLSEQLGMASLHKFNIRRCTESYLIQDLHPELSLSRCYSVHNAWPYILVAMQDVGLTTATLPPAFRNVQPAAKELARFRPCHVAEVMIETLGIRMTARRRQPCRWHG